MKRTLNYTGRKRLGIDHVTIRLRSAPGQPRSFGAEFKDLTELQIAPDAKVYVEPYAKSSSMRFDFGSVADPVAPSDTALIDIDAGASVLFDVKIVDETGEVGKILASARHIHPLDASDGDDNRSSLLPVETRDLGELVWELEMEPGARPRLLLNSRIPNVVIRLKADPLFQGAVLPHAIARILSQILDPQGDGADEEEWVRDWKTWFAETTGLDADEEEDEELRRPMVDTACKAFAFQQRFATHADALTSLQEVPSDD